MAKNDWVMSFLADILGAEVERPIVTETTALGAALLAGLGAGIFDSSAALTDIWQSETVFTPRLSKAERDHAYNGWLAAIERIRCA